MWYASFIQFGKIDTDTTGQKWLVVFLYAFLRKEVVKEHEKNIYQSANERKIR